MLPTDTLLIYILLQLKLYPDGFHILKNFGFIDVQVIRNSKNEVVERRIYIIDNKISTYCFNSQYPSCVNNQYPIDLNIKDNIIDLKIERLFNYVMNDEVECYEGFTEDERKQFKSVVANLQFNYTKESIKYLSEDNKVMVKYIIYFLSDITRSKRMIVQNNTIRALLIHTYNKCKEKQKEYLGTTNEINNFYEYFYKSASLELSKI